MPMLFSYGTLRLEDVQRKVFGRRVASKQDALVGFVRESVVIEGATEANVRFAGGSSRVDGVVLDVTDDELARADDYELPYGYERIAVKLASGTEAWVYVHGA